jgi:hypothetical protein
MATAAMICAYQLLQGFHMSPAFSVVPYSRHGYNDDGINSLRNNSLSQNKETLSGVILQICIQRGWY